MGDDSKRVLSVLVRVRGKKVLLDNLGALDELRGTVKSVASLAGVLKEKLQQKGNEAETTRVDPPHFSSLHFSR